MDKVGFLQSHGEGEQAKAGILAGCSETFRERGVGEVDRKAGSHPQDRENKGTNGPGSWAGSALVGKQNSGFGRQ